jgi:hypothetical protein
VSWCPALTYPPLHVCACAGAGVWVWRPRRGVPSAPGGSTPQIWRPPPVPAARQVGVDTVSSKSALSIVTLPLLLYFACTFPRFHALPATRHVRSGRERVLPSRGCYLLSRLPWWHRVTNPRGRQCQPVCHVLPGRRGLQRPHGVHPLPAGVGGAQPPRGHRAAVCCLVSGRRMAIVIDGHASRFECRDPQVFY